MVAKHRQVKTMLWYPLRDEGNWTTGLETSEGIHKAAYYAFSGRNSVTLAAPASVQAAEAFAVSGVLRGREGVLAGKQVQLETRLPWQISWTTLRSTSTRSDGAYTFSSVKQAQSSYYRVRWSGVCESVKGLVLTK